MCTTSKMLQQCESGNTFLRRSTRLAALALFVISPIASAGAQTTDIDHWSEISAATNLEGNGNIPFHLKMTFQMYDLEGKPAETGTVEEWWASPNSHRITINSPSLKDDGSSPDKSSPSVTRERFLVDELIEAAVHPVPKKALTPSEETNEHTRKFGNISLNCLTRTPGKSGVAAVYLSVLCIKPATDDLRLISRPTYMELVTRNSLGTFGNTHVALDLQVNFVGVEAITGKVTVLQSFDPSEAEAGLKSTAAPTGTDSPVVSSHIPGGVVAGRRIGFVQPEYPDIAKAQHLSGSVLLRAIITKDGTVSDLLPIASASQLFTGAAMQAVRQWKYAPYLLNGVPTEVDTTITVNFEMP